MSIFSPLLFKILVFHSQNTSFCFKDHNNSQLLSYRYQNTIKAQQKLQKKVVLVRFYCAMFLIIALTLNFCRPF